MGAEKTKLATTRPGLPRDGAAGLDSRGTIPTPPSPSLCACSSIPVGLGKRLLPVLVPPLQNISAINSFCHNARTMNTSRDEQRPKVFDKRSIVKLNRGEGGSLFYDLKTLPFSHFGGILGDTKGRFVSGIFCKRRSIRPRRESEELLRALAKLEKMDNAFTNNKLTKNKALLLLL